MATFKGKVTGGGLNLRTEANTNASSPIQIPNGISISVSTISGNQEWFSTSYGGHSGYVVAQYVAITAGGDTCTVTTSSGSLNIRKKASSGATVVYTAAKGSTLRLLDSTSVPGWYRVSSASGTGWGSSSFLTAGSNPGGGNTGTGTDTGTPTAGVIKGTSVRVREEPNTTSEVLAQVNTGDKVTYYAGESYSGSGYNWYRCTSSKWSGDGYIATNYVVKDTGISGGGTGSSDDFSDNVTTNPTITTYYAFNPSAAVTYAKNHSSNTNTDSNGNKVADPKRNKSFGEGTSNACANFVHQCLLAGGARMFDGWCYKLTGIPSTWDSASWTLTNKGRRRLLEKKWIERIPVTSVKAGDIIYTYYSDYKQRNMNTPFNHVTIAVTDYSSSDQGCYVCGHTTNQNNKPKKLSATGIPCAYCYRVKFSLGGDGTEKVIDLTDGNSKAI